MLVYLAALRCIDYLNLTDNNCWIGTTSQNKERRQKVDLGSDNKLSRHTIHTAQGEYDPRTNNKLPTVPPGELASVRLGNWNTGAEAECIEYSFTVDASNAAVLMMKYAVIMDEPSSPHAYDAQSSFELKILRGNAETSQNVWWKEWTTIGVNLKEYDGETLTIRVTTRDCTASGHYGYAYFTLSCSDGKMDGIGCGDNPTTNFIAPEGFKYKWYLPDNENDILSTSQTFDVDPRDTLTYYCDVIFPRNENCYFTLTASAVPRYPVAETSYEISHDNCMNLVSFENTSHVMTVNQITEDSTHTTTFCDWVEWDFGDGKISDQYSPIHEFPLDGGTYTIKMKTGISICVDSVEFTIELPRLGSTFDTITEYACLGSPYELPSGRQVWGSGFYNDTVPSELYDCHDVYVYSLNFGSASNVEIWDTICSGESYYFNGSYYTSSGVHRLENRNIFGCDSSTALYLTVTEAVQIQLEETDIYACQDADIIEIPYTILSGKVSSYYLNFTYGLENMSGIAQSPLVIPISDMPPGNYPAVLVFFDEECGNDTIILTLHFQYPFSIVAQRWNDVLAVKSQAHNGGYVFSSYQWYKDNLPIEGANKSYLFEPAGLNMEALFHNP